MAKRTETDGSRFKAAILETYGLNPAELLLLDEAVAHADALKRINAQVSEAPLLTEGSTGQAVENPLLRSQRAHAAQLARLIESLNLPRRDEESGMSATSRAAQVAARARWAQRKRRA